MTKQEEQQRIEKMRSRIWRLNNIYWIKTKKGRYIKFKLNITQRLLFKNLHFLNVILKARQTGMTTFICIFALDTVLFEMKDAGFCAHTMDDAKKIFRDKIRYAWENLPDWVKIKYDVNMENVRTLEFTRKRDGQKGSVYVGTSLRGGTYQFLHLSELGTLDQKYPEKSKELKTGALNTIHAGNIVFIESTAKGQFGVFHDICQQAEIMAKEDKQLGKLDYKFFFFPWFIEPEYTDDTPSVIPRVLQDYFEKIEKELSIQLTRGQKVWYMKKKATMGYEMFSEFPSTSKEAFRASVEGSYYGKQIDWLREKKHIVKLPYEPKLKVDTWWDLGIGDSTSIIFTQQYGLEIRIIDYYENQGEGLVHYAKILQEKPYAYNSHNAPHDIEVRELTTGKTRRETAISLGLNFNVVDKLSIEDGIEAVRNLLPKCWFDEVNTSELIKALTEYRKEWDDKLGTFKSQPLHNWASDSADAMRTLAVGIKDNVDMNVIGLDETEREIYYRNLNKETPKDPFNTFMEL